MAVKKHYLDRHEFHAELTICKKQDGLTKKALEMFQLLSEQISRDFYFSCDEDRKDAIAVAMHDLFKYWKNFKESNIVQLKINRNFEPVESITVFIHGHGKVRYVAGRKQNPEKRMFLIGDTINNSLKNLTDAIVEKDNDILAIYTDKIKNKITLMDKFNGDDLSVKSYVVAKSKKINAEVKVASDNPKDKGKKKSKDVYLVDPIKDEFVFKMKEPPNAFSYFTTMVRNGILKSINKINPKQFRGGNKISLDGINSDNNGMFNI